MNYVGYTEFPFPSLISPEEQKLKDFFFTLSDEEQLTLLNKSVSYETFRHRVFLYKATNGEATA